MDAEFLSFQFKLNTLTVFMRTIATKTLSTIVAIAITGTVGMTTVKAQANTDVTTNQKESQMNANLIKVSNKVFDGTVSASIAFSGQFFALLGDPNKPDGTLGKTAPILDYRITGGFVNASAGLQQVRGMINLADTVNYAMSPLEFISQATIQKALVTIKQVVIKDKLEDGTNMAAIEHSVATVQAGDPHHPDGTMITKPFDRYEITGQFDDASPGINKAVKLAVRLFDAANYEIASIPINVTGSITRKIQ